MKTCVRCNTEKDLDDFPVRKQGKQGRGTHCWPCHRERDAEYSRNWRKNNPERRAAIQAAYNQGPTKLGQNRKWRFGLSPESVEALLEAQGGVCGLCRREFSGGETFVDHDHACCPGRTQKTCGQCVRAILCRRCNQGLGYFFDDPQLLRAAADYIERHRDQRLVE